MSHECFESLLKAIKSMLPEVEKLPDNYYYCKKMVKKLGLGYQKIDACPNDCMLFYKEDENMTKCTICGHDRFKPKKDGVTTKKSLIPFKILRYFPITDRLKRLYMSSRTAEHMRWHARSPSNDGELNHPVDGQAWKDFDKAHPQFASETRNVRLGLSTDGFNPFGHSAVPYSCWPVIVTPYNLPPWMCMKQPYLFLSLMIPGPNSPGKNLDVYLRPLIDELKVLWRDGVQTWDVSTKSNFNLKAALMWTISDFPAYGMLSGWSTHGKLACPYCMEHTKSFNLQKGRKPCWFDCHRRFLPADHPFRRNREHFRKGKIENDNPLPRLSGTEVRARVMRLPVVPFGKNDKKINGFGESHNWVRTSIFWELPYWSTNLIRHNLDVMHVEKNVFDNVFNTVMNVKGKTKDNDKARLDLKDICKRPTLEIHESVNGKTVKPHARYTLTKKQVEEVCTWIKSLKLPDGYASNISRCVSDKTPNGKLKGMKSHDCHVFLERLLPIAFRDLLYKPIWDAVTELSRFFNDLCSKTLNEKDMNILEKNIIEVTCKLEKIFPPGFFDSMEHLTIHLPYEARVGGPVQYRWMYPFERLMGMLKRAVKNRACVEGSICEAYSFNEISTFVADYFPDEVLTKANRVSRHDDGGNIELNGRLSIFGLSGRAYGKGRRIFLSENDLLAAHTYVLLNCDEIDEYVRLYDAELKVKHPNISDKDIQVNRYNGFSLWIKDKALSEGSMIPANVQALAMGPDMDQVSYNGYKVNGYDFHTKTYGSGKRTMNSGVCVQGDRYDELNKSFYGELEEIVELSYKGTYGGYINMFKCRWFDSDKGIRVDRHRIIDIDINRSAYSNEPFVLPNQTVQVYYTSGPGRKRDRPPSNWQTIIHTPARRREEVVSGEFYQEQMLHRPTIVNVDENEVIQLDGGDEPHEIDPELILVPNDTDTEEEELLTDYDSESESEADDGYESIGDESDHSDYDT
nr:PREDICTED: uncharacterized protein LOC108212485 [Daucus carota subsp. sativus]